MHNLKPQIEIIYQILVDNELKLVHTLRHEFWKKHYPLIYNDVLEYGKLINKEKISEIVYWIINDIKEQPKCKICKVNTTRFKNVENGYINTCGKKCASQDKDKIARSLSTSRKTCFDKYGVDNVSKLKEIKEKKIATSMKNYGVEYNTQRKEIRKLNSDMMKSEEHIIKIKKGIKKSLGVENPSLCIDIMSKRNETFISKKIKRLIKYTKDLNIKFKKYIDNYNIIFSCDNCLNDFSINYQLFHLRKGRNEEICTKCNVIHKPVSVNELMLLEFIKENYKGEIIENDRKILDGKEIDIYLPELKLGFEFNGLYWHSEYEKCDTYHLNKTEKCEKLNIQLIHIYEDDWLYKQDIIKSRILSKLNITERIYARKCILKEVCYNDKKLFLIKNHIQGDCISQYNIGLYYNDILVSLMTFGNRKLNIERFELLRFCNRLNTTIIGGASKLFKYFISTYKIESIISYADRSWSNGNLYEQLNFNFEYNTKANYWWIVDGVKQHRSKFNKQTLIKLGYSKNDTEIKIMHNLGYYRIFDSGSKLFNYTL